MKNFKVLKFCIFFVFIAQTSFICPNVPLPGVFGSNMVRQRNADLLIWDWAKPLEVVKVTNSWNNVTVSDTTEDNAELSIVLKTPSASEPDNITITGYNTIVSANVLVGEVWLCSDQSNMEASVTAGINNAVNEISNANYPEIRFFHAPVKAAKSPQLDLKSERLLCSPQTTAEFSAVAFFFGKKLFKNINAPIGLIHSSCGSMPAEVWINAQGLNQNKDLIESSQKIPESRWATVYPGVAYNAMIAPLIPFKIAGIIWYQSDTNLYNPETYSELFNTLIDNCRDEWGYEFPFYFVQITPFDYGKQPVGVLIRDAQRLSTIIPNTGMVVTSDIRDINDQHRRNKKRGRGTLANWALWQTYDRKMVIPAGPSYREMKIEDQKIRLFFDYAENGLVRKGEHLIHFQIAGQDRKFIKANAFIEDNSIVVYSSSIKSPLAVRFAWSSTAEPNLFNAEGLPALCFRTDDWEIILDWFEILLSENLTF